MADTTPTSVDEYIAAQEPDFQQTLRELRALIREEAPDAEERIAYQVPAYKLHYMLVSFGVTKSACSFYTQSPALVEQMKEELRGVKVSGATLHFPPGQPLPEEPLRRLIRARIEENEARAAQKRVKR
jgi:uncharacterized protein YdhG (YjbR/CyaY superfamily)